MCAHFCHLIFQPQIVCIAIVSDNLFDIFLILLKTIASCNSNFLQIKWKIKTHDFDCDFPPIPQEVGHERGTKNSTKCTCDDCFLGITDILAEVAILNLKIERQKSLEPVPDFNKLMLSDVTDEGKLIRKVRKKKQLSGTFFQATHATYTCANYPSFPDKIKNTYSPI